MPVASRTKSVRAEIRRKDRFQLRSKSWEGRSPRRDKTQPSRSRRQKKDLRFRGTQAKRGQVPCFFLSCAARSPAVTLGTSRSAQYVRGGVTIPASQSSGSRLCV